MKRLMMNLFSLIGLLLSISALFGMDADLTIRMADRDEIPSYGTAAGVWFYADEHCSSQILLLGFNQSGIDQKPHWKMVFSLDKKEPVTLTFSLPEPAPVALSLQWTTESGNVTFSSNGKSLTPDGTSLVIPVSERQASLTLTSESKTAAFVLTDLTTTTESGSEPLALKPIRRPFPVKGPFATFPDVCPNLTPTLLAWDWQMQDGVGTPLECRTWYEAAEVQLSRGQLLLNDLIEHQLLKGNVEDYQKRWSELKNEFQQYKTKVKTAETDSQKTERIESEGHDLWLRIHQLKREILFACDYFPESSILFAKHVPSCMSHQLTQVYGFCARPGGGLYCLAQPGKSLHTECLTSTMPVGNYMHPTLSYDGEYLFFAFCEAPDSPQTTPDLSILSRVYQLYRMKTDGSELTRLTNDSFDNFSPLVLPGGDIMFCSTRRGGFHRCGSGPCPVYTLSRMKPDGSDPHSISFHETHEWNPTLANDGRIIYTRWDYVDRDAVHYQNLWSARQDGTDVRIFYGNNTVQIAGLWEAKAVPDSSKIMAIAGPHHGVSAGSVVLIDAEKGVDGPDSVTRVTPEVLYPESEAPVVHVPCFPVSYEFDTPIKNNWKSIWNPQPKVFPEEQRRWPGHTFKSPWPFSEKYFLASYTFDRLIGEEGPNIPNQYGIYMCDAFGNRELLYRDPNMSSVWAMPMEERPEPNAYVSTLPEREGAPQTGQFFLQNVYESWPYKIPDKVHALRIVEVLRKSTPNIDQPPVGAALAAPGKRVLGTVPVESDGSAWFELPAETPILFQALDKNGRMIQGMRSLVYLQKGEVASCTGCHEDRLSSVPVSATLASRRNQPTQLTPGPDGSNPLSFPLLVQPVLDRLCVSCHNADKAEGKIDLTGVPAGKYTKSYNALIPYVSFSAWGRPQKNYEPRTEPNRFGARGSRLTKILDNGHYDCKLTEDDWNRLTTWMDANALFFGTFNVHDQQRQRSGERLRPDEVE